MLAPITRILLRYIAGILIARGIFDAGTGNFFATDPDIYALAQAGIGLAVGFITEGYYWLAKKFGWST